MSDAKRVIYDARASSGLRADGMRARRDGKGDRLAASWKTILSPRHRDLRETIREGEKERRNMIRRKTAVAVLIAVIVGAAFAAYTFRPKATTSSVAVNEPGTDTGNPGTGLGLPDRDDAFDLVHRPGACGERLGPMGRGAREHDRVPSDRDAAHSVDDRHLERAELLLRPFDELRQGSQCHRLVDLVVEG